FADRNPGPRKSINRCVLSGRAQAPGCLLMKRTFHWVTAAIFMLTAGIAAARRNEPVSPVLGASSSIPGLSLSIRLAKPRFPADEPVVLEAIIGNRSGSPVILGDSASDFGSFDFSVEYVAGGLFQHA